MMLPPYKADQEAYRPSSLINGVMVGIVTDNKDPEGLHRVKLKLPLIEGEGETDWARITTLMGGKDQGTLFLPEVNDEVLVAFHLGEFRHPYVIGVLWNKKNKPPKGDEDNNIRKIRSKSGHELIMNDKSGEEQVTIKTKKGNIVEMIDKTDTIKISESGGANDIVIKGGSSGEISLKSGTSSIKLNAKGEITITGGTKVILKGVEVQVEASGSLNLKANAELNINSSGLLNIKGSMVNIKGSMVKIN